MKRFDLLLTAAVAVAVSGASAQVWDFTTGTVPAGGTLGAAARVIEGKGLVTTVGPRGLTASGFIMQPVFEYPTAFRMEFDTVLDENTNALSHVTVLWDDMNCSQSINLPAATHRGLQVVVQRYFDQVDVVVNVGFGDRTLKYASNTLYLHQDDALHVAIDYYANRRMCITCNGTKTLHVLPVATPILKTDKKKTVIGDRLGSYYYPFEGAIKTVSVTELPFAPLYLVLHDRMVFERGEENALCPVTLGNAGEGAIAEGRLCVRQFGDAGAVVACQTNLIGSVAAKDEVLSAFAVETCLRTGEKRVECIFDGKVGDEDFAVTNEFAVTIAPRFAERMPVVAWGYGDCATETNFGFTHGTVALGVDTPATDSTDWSSVRQKLDDGLKNGFRLIKSCKVVYPAATSDYSPYRMLRDGSVPKPTEWGIEVSQPEIQEYAYRIAAENAAAYGTHPAFGGILAVSEHRDTIFPSFNTESIRYRRETGEWVPEEAVAQHFDENWRHTALAARFPTGIVPEDDPVYRYYKWFWGGGDGWPGYSSALADGFRTGLGRQPFFSFFDPAVRCPPVWGSGGNVDVLNQWCYANPDPMNVAGTVESMFAMAEGCTNQQVMIHTQVICYRTQTSPTNVVLQTTPQWALDFPVAEFPAASPDSLQEATWSMLAKPVRGIMYHGYQCYVDTGVTTGYSFTNTNVPTRLRHLLRNVVAPLGPSLLEIGRDRSEVAVMPGGTTDMLGGTTYTNDRFPAVNMLERARLDPRVVYEDAVLKNGLDGVRVLYLSKFSYATQSVLDRIAAFRAAGGLVVADSNVISAVSCDYKTPVVSETSSVAAKDDASVTEIMANVDPNARTTGLKTLNAQITMTNEAEKLRIRLAELGYAAKVGSSSPEIVVYARKWQTTPYLFAINDRRKFGDYFGPWGLTMEEGMSNSGTVSIADPGYAVGAVYELSRGAECAFTQADGRVTVPVSFETNDGRFFVFLEEKIGSVNLAAPTRVARGEAIVLDFTVRGVSGNPIEAVLPVEIRITDGEGRELDGAGYAAAKGGVCHLSVPTNLDDPDGGFHIVATDRASGLVAEADVAIGDGSSGTTLTIPSGTKRILADADVATFAVLDSLVIEGELALGDLTTELNLRARISGGGRLTADGASGGLVLSGNNSAFAGEMTFADTPVTVASRHGLGSPTRTVTHNRSRLLFRDEGLVNDVPLALGGTRTGALAFTEDPSDFWDQRGAVTWLPAASATEIDLGATAFSGGAAGADGSFVAHVAPGRRVSIDDLPLSFGSAASDSFVCDLAPGAYLQLAAAGSRAVAGVLAFGGSGRVLCGCAGALAGGAVGVGGAEATTLDLAGCDQRVDALRNCAYPSFTVTRGCAGYGVVASKSAATLEIVGSTEEKAAVRFVEHAALTYGGKGTLSLVNQRSTTDGLLTVTSGTVRIEWGAAWDGNVRIAGTGSLVVAADSSLHPEGISEIAFADSGRLTVTGGVLRCSRLTGPFGEKGAGVYTKSDLGGFLVGNGKISVAPGKAMGEIAIWSGGAGSDTSVGNAANWKYGRVPKFDGSDVLVFSNTTAATRATLPGGLSAAYQIVFETASDFALDAPEGVTLTLGPGGLSSRASSSAKIVTNTLNVAVQPALPLVNWEPASGTALEYRGGLVMPAASETFTLAGAGYHVFSHPCDRLESTVAVTTKRVKFAGAGLTNSLSLLLSVGSQSLADSLIGNVNDALVLNGPLNWTTAGCIYFFVGREAVFNGGIGPKGSPVFNTASGASSEVFVTNAPIKLTSTTYIFWQSGITAHLGAQNGAWKYLGADKRIVCENENVLAGGNVFFGQFRNYGSCTIDMNGYDQDFSSIARYDINAKYPAATKSTTAYGTLTSTRPATARLTKKNGKAGVYPLLVTGAVTLEQSGGGTNVIVNQKSTTTGSLVVSGGSLELLWGAGFTKVPAVAISSGLLKVDGDSAPYAFGEREGASRATLRLSNGGRLEIESGTATVRRLYVDGRRYPIGTYGSATNADIPEAFRLPSIVGDGTLRVLGSGLAIGLR